MLIGNKADKDAERKISQEKGLAKAKENNMLFLETSCANNINVEKAFQEIVSHLIGGNSIITQPGIGTSILLNQHMRKLSLDETVVDSERRKKRCC